MLRLVLLELALLRRSRPAARLNALLLVPSQGSRTCRCAVVRCYGVMLRTVEDERDTSWDGEEERDPREDREEVDCG